MVCGLSFIVGLYGDWKIHEGIKSVKNSTDDALNWFNQIKNETQIVSKEVSDVSNVLKDLIVNIEGLNRVLPPNELPINHYIEESKAISNFLKQIEYKINESNKTVNKVDVDFVPNYIEKYGNLFCIVVLCVLLVLSLIGLIFTFAICSRCLLGCLTLLAVISLILCSLMSGITFGSSVGVSDFCFDAKPWIKTQINQNEINDYIVDCPAIDNNIISKYIKEAEEYLNSAKNTKEKLENILKDLESKPNVCQKECKESEAKIRNNLNDLSKNLDNIQQLVVEFKNLVNCRRINDNLNESLNSICTDVIKGISMIFFNTIASSLCFAFLVFSATFALR